MEKTIGFLFGIAIIILLLLLVPSYMIYTSLGLVEITVNFWSVVVIWTTATVCIVSLRMVDNMLKLAKGRVDHDNSW